MFHPVGPPGRDIASAAGTHRVPLSEEAAAAHAQAVAAGEPGYADPTSGLFVLTAAYLLDRGTCCDNGCRHCPYGE